MYSASAKPIDAQTLLKRALNFRSELTKTRKRQWHAGKKNLYARRSHLLNRLKVRRSHLSRKKGDVAWLKMAKKSRNVDKFHGKILHWFTILWFIVINIFLATETRQFLVRLNFGKKSMWKFSTRSTSVFRSDHVKIDEIYWHKSRKKGIIKGEKNGKLYVVFKYCGQVLRRKHLPEPNDKNETNFCFFFLQIRTNISNCRKKGRKKNSLTFDENPSL